MLGTINSKSVKELSTLIDIIKNADKYKKLIKELDEKFDELTTARNELTLAQELTKEIALYEDRQKELNKRVAEFNSTKHVKMSEAEQKAAKIINEAERKAQIALQNANQKLNEAQTKTVIAENKEQEADELLQLAEQKVKHAIERDEQSKKFKKEMEAKKAAIEAALKDVN